jgi:hypothetical protein
MAWMASGAPRLPLVEDSATSLLLVSCTPRDSGQAYTATFLLRFQAAIKSDNAAHGTPIVIRQVRYLHNIVEQDHRAVKRVTRPLLGCKAFDAAQDTLVGIELMHMIKKRQLVVEAGEERLTAAELFDSLAA